MGKEPMGNVLATVAIENLADLYAARRGEIPAEGTRRIEVDDARIVTGATMLGIPKRLIGTLGLVPGRTHPTRTAAGSVTVRIYGTVRLSIQGRECTCDVKEVPDDGPVLIGKVPLGLLDFVVDPAGRRLIGNPEHGGEHILEMY